MKRTYTILLIILLAAGVFPLLCQQGILSQATHTRQLPEVIVKSRRKDANVMHISGIIREYSYLQRRFDTVFMYRDKAVDFMIPLPTVKKFAGWKVARPLRTDTYYQFFDYNGMDSVSDKYYINFSLGNRLAIPGEANVAGCTRDSLAVSVCLTDDKNAECWQPGVSSFFQRNKSISRFDVRYLFEDVDGMSRILPVYLSGATYTLESNGPLEGTRLPGLVNKSFQVNTRCELYITGRRFLTVKEARKYQSQPSLALEHCDFSTAGLPHLSPHIRDLIARVKAIDHLNLRTGQVPDSLIKGFYYTHPARAINFRNWIRGMVGLPAKPRK